MLRYFQKAAPSTKSDATLSIDDKTEKDKNQADSAGAAVARRDLPSNADGSGTGQQTQHRHHSFEDQDTDQVDDASRPFLSDEDELFLLRLASEGEAPSSKPLPGPSPTPTRTSSEGQEMAAASEVSTREEKDASSSADGAEPGSVGGRHWTTQWLDWGFRPQPDRALRGLRQMAEARHEASVRRDRSKDLTQAADALKSAANEVKRQSVDPTGDSESKEEQKQVSSILKGLDLSSINNRVVGVSHDTQKLLEAFNQVLKDIVNGVPTAYDDLEKLLTERQKQLDKLYGSLPSYLQSLIKTMPVKVWALMAPQVAAAMPTEKSEKEGLKDPEGNRKEKKKRSGPIPTLKNLIGQKGAVAGMLRSIITFLEARFPALLAGTNVIVSMAVFILLFIFWYCHKRGREARLAREQTAGDFLTDDDLLSDLEKEDGLEESQHQADAEIPVRDQKDLQNVKDSGVEKSVETLMQQLAQPTGTNSHRALSFSTVS